MGKAWFRACICIYFCLYIYVRKIGKQVYKANILQTHTRKVDDVLKITRLKFSQTKIDQQLFQKHKQISKCWRMMIWKFRARKLAGIYLLDLVVIVVVCGGGGGVLLILTTDCKLNWIYLLACKTHPKRKIDTWFLIIIKPQQYDYLLL